jgi:GAF domain-containing protein
LQALPAVGKPASEAEMALAETLLEDVFLEMQEIYEPGRTLQEIIDFILDLSISKIASEAGSILFADINGRDLYFAAARGSKADEIMGFRIPMGEGIVGFCATNGVALAVSDVGSDPRFYKHISEKLNYPTRSLLCAPIEFEGRVYGAIELVNRRGGPVYTTNELNVLVYISQQIGQYLAMSL